MFDNPTIDDFKNYFVRDFPYGVDMTQNVLDSDIAKAFGQTNVNMNPAIWGTQDAYTIGYLFLAAHYLVVDIEMSSQGLSATGSWITQSKSVGSVSESYAIPQRILDNPEMALISKTKYGLKYLQLLLPNLAGQMFSVCGGTYA